MASIARLRSASTRASASMVFLTFWTAARSALLRRGPLAFAFGCTTTAAPSPVDSTSRKSGIARPHPDNPNG
jgi:hypothetical protein